MNIGLTVSEKSVFSNSFGCGRFLGNLLSFEKHKLLQKILFEVICLEIFSFFSIAVDEN